MGDFTWAALSKVPPLALGVGGVMAGVWWVVGRRAKLAGEKATDDAKTPPETAPEAEEEEE